MINLVEVDIRAYRQLEETPNCRPSDANEEEEDKEEKGGKEENDDDEEEGDENECPIILSL